MATEAREVRMGRLVIVKPKIEGHDPMVAVFAFADEAAGKYIVVKLFVPCNGEHEKSSKAGLTVVVCDTPKEAAETAEEIVLATKLAAIIVSSGANEALVEGEPFTELSYPRED